MLALAIELCRLTVAGLSIALEAGTSEIPLAFPEGYAAFRGDGTAADELVLHVTIGPPSDREGWRLLCGDSNTWQHWRDRAGRRVFVSPPMSPPRRQITVDPDYCVGEVAGEFNQGAWTSQPVYPLRDVDTRLYASWLAEFGDLTLHASGVEVAGAGYAFVGPSGAGKSTLASALATIPEVTVLGEDTVITRRIEGQFLLFGTPWHTNPERCAPGGVPLRKLFFLDRTAEAGIRAIRPLEGVRRVMQDSFIPYYDREGVGRILDTLGRLAEQVPFYSLSYQLGSDVLRLIREA